MTLQPFAPDEPWRAPDAGTTDAGAYNNSDAGASGTAGSSGATGVSGNAAAGTSGTTAGRAGASGRGGQAAMDAGTPSCAGQLVFNICWYLGAERQNCQNVCAAHGGFDTQSITHVGTPAQGGSRDDCQQILNALGRRATVVESKRSDGQGLGCHVWQDRDNYWLIDPLFDPNEQLPSNAPVRISCGCER